MTRLEDVTAYARVCSKFFMMLIRRCRPENQDIGLPPISKPVRDAVQSFMLMFDNGFDFEHLLRHVIDLDLPVDHPNYVPLYTWTRNPSPERDREISEMRYNAMLRLAELSILEDVGFSGRKHLVEEFVLLSALKRDFTFVSPDLITPSISPLLFMQRTVTLARLAEFYKVSRNFSDRYRKNVIDGYVAQVSFGESASSAYQCLKLVKGCADSLKVSANRNKARRRHITTDAINPILRIKDKNELSANRFRSGIDEMFSCLDGLIKKALLGLQRPTIDLDPAALHDNLTNERPNYGFIKDPANRPFVDHQDRLLYHVQSTEAIRSHFYDAIGRRVILNDQSVQAWIGI